MLRGALAFGRHGVGDVGGQVRVDVEILDGERAVVLDPDPIRTGVCVCVVSGCLAVCASCVCVWIKWLYL